MSRHAQRAFTLLETLVALAILAVALSAGLRAVGNTAQSAASLRDSLIADWVAHDRLAELRITGAFPDLGTLRGEVSQAGRRLTWEQRVAATPNSLFRRVEVQVFDADNGRPLGQLSGFVARPLR